MSDRTQFIIGAVFLITMAMAGWHAGGVAWNG